MTRKYTKKDTEYVPIAETNVPITLNELEILAYHLYQLATYRGRLGLQAHARMPVAEIEITASGHDNPIAPALADVWDSVWINGHWCGNRHGGAKAYVRMVAGDPVYWRAR